MLTHLCGRRAGLSPAFLHCSVYSPCNAVSYRGEHKIAYAKMARLPGILTQGLDGQSSRL